MSYQLLNVTNAVTEEVTEKVLTKGETIMASLDIMWKGMLAIFVVIGAIILVTAILNRVTNRKKKEKKEDQ